MGTSFQFYWYLGSSRLFRTSNCRKTPIKWEISATGRELEFGRMSALIANPDDLRFTQDSIAIKFRYPYDHLRIDDAVEQIQQGLLTASEITPMNVVRYNGILWSLDNRRLWVFRRARVQKVTVNIVSSSYSQRSLTFFMSLDDQLERTYSSPLYYPRVRGTVRSSIFTRVRVSSAVLPSSSQRAAVLPPSSLLGRQSSSTSSSRNTHLPVPVHSYSSVGSWESRGVSRPAPSYTGSQSRPAPFYTGSHSRDSNSATNNDFLLCFSDIFKVIIDFFKRL
jgi:hypothetical protein